MLYHFPPWSGRCLACPLCLWSDYPQIFSLSHYDSSFGLDIKPRSWPLVVIKNHMAVFTRVRVIKPLSSGQIPAWVITFCQPEISPAVSMAMLFLTSCPKLLNSIVECYWIVIAFYSEPWVATFQWWMKWSLYILCTLIYYALWDLLAVYFVKVPAKWVSHS